MQTFSQKFKNISEDMCTTKRWKAACRIVAKKIVSDNLALRKTLVGQLLKTIRTVGQQSFSDDVFEEGSHTVSSEPFFRDTSYKAPVLKQVTIIDHKNKCLATEVKSFIDKNEYSLEGIVIAVDTNGKCHLTLDDTESSKTWKCDLTCKEFCSDERQSLIDLKNVYQ